MKHFPNLYLYIVIFLSLSCGNVYADPTSLSLESIIKIINKKKTKATLNIQKIYKAKNYYFQILSYQEELKVSEEVRKHFEKAVSKAEVKFSKGDDEISQSSITKLKLGLSGTLNAIIELKSNIAQARISLGEIIGIDLREKSFAENHIQLVSSFLAFR